MHLATESHFGLFLKWTSQYTWFKVAKHRDERKGAILVVRTICMETGDLYQFTLGDNHKFPRESCLNRIITEKTI